MKKLMTLALILVPALSWISDTALAGSAEVPVVRLSAEAEVAAPPQAVWSYMTAGRNLVRWCPYWTGNANAGADLDEVGDVLQFEDGWGSVGRSVVTYLDPNREIRIAHEPDNGSYVCQSRLILEPTEKGTRVVYLEQYTDESDPGARKETASGMEAEMAKTLQMLKEGVQSSGK